MTSFAALGLCGQYLTPKVFLKKVILSQIFYNTDFMPRAEIL